jgi:hypothetical protein
MIKKLNLAEDGSNERGGYGSERCSRDNITSRGGRETNIGKLECQRTARVLPVDDHCSRQAVSFTEKRLIRKGLHATVDPSERGPAQTS